MQVQKHKLIVSSEAGRRVSNSLARRWGRRLAAEVQRIVLENPEVDPEDVRLTLISLELPPLARLNRSLRRGRGFASFQA